MNYIRLPWSELEHAYGSANCVEDLLANLESSDEVVWRQANYDLGGTIYHQGSVYSSTVKAIPRLVEMLFSESDPKRGCIINLLGFIAEGIGQSEINFAEECAYSIFNKGKSEIPYIMESAIEGEDHTARALEILCYLYMPLIESSINSEDDLERQGIAGALGSYINQYPHYEKLLRERMTIETEVDVIEVIKEALSKKKGI